MSYEKLYQKLNYRFKNENLLIQALTRTSAFNIKPELRQNGNFQRLEFIGDKILGQIISDIFFDHYPDWTVGVLTTTVANHVNNQGPLAEIAYYLGLDKLLIMDQGEELNLVRVNTKVLSDATEALIGAIWIDSNRDYTLLRKIIWEQWNLVNELPLLTTKEFGDLLYSLVPDEDYQKKICLLFEKQCDQTLIDKLLLYHQYDDESLWILKTLLEKKPSKQSLNNALINAILENNISVIQKLLEHDADSNFIYSPGNIENWDYRGLEIYDNYRNTSYSALQIAIIQDSAPYTMVKLLLSYGADPNWNQGWSRKHTSKEMLQNTLDDVYEDIMTTNGLDRFFSPKERSLTLEELAYMFMQSHEPKEKLLNLNTALHVAVMYQEHENKIEVLIDILLKAGADPNLRNHEEKTPLDIVNSNDELSKNIILVNLLSENMEPRLEVSQSFHP